jgi:4-hydroxy-3-polyprenylbenzoate decarboxylase
LAAYIIALTGASGAIYGIRLVQELLKRGDDIDLVISPSGFLILREECGFSPEDGLTEAKIREFFKAGRKGKIRYYESGDLGAPSASGSARKKAMIICPCSMGTLGRIASGVSGNLIERSADCVLKEGKPLVLVPRETPLNLIHLENMVRLKRAGATILPAMPGFYSRPGTIDDMVNFVVGKVLDSLGIDNELYERWGK